MLISKGRTLHSIGPTYFAQMRQKIYCKEERRNSTVIQVLKTFYFYFVQKDMKLSKCPRIEHHTQFMHTLTYLAVQLWIYLVRMQLFAYTVTCPNEKQEFPIN